MRHPIVPRLGACALALTALGGCVPTAAPENVILPAAAAMASEGRTTTRTTIDGATTTTTRRSSTTSAGLSVAPVQALIAPLPAPLPAPAAGTTVILVPAGPATPKAADFAGRWQAQVEGQRWCDITLSQDGGADADISCPQSLFFLSGWRYLGGEIQLTSNFPHPIAVLQPQTTNRFSGPLREGGARLTLVR